MIKRGGKRLSFDVLTNRLQRSQLAAVDQEVFIRLALLLLRQRTGKAGHALNR